MVAQASILGRVIDFISSQPTDQQIIALRATEEEEERVDYLSGLKNTGVITKEQEVELYNSFLAEYILGIAKANALGRAKEGGN